MTRILEVQNLAKEYRVRGTNELIPAVNGITFAVNRGETLGIVGESGCGKSTMARLLVGLEQPSRGRIFLDGTDITNLRGRSLLVMHRRIQLVFQDPYSSLNPRMTVGKAVVEPLEAHNLCGSREGRQRRVFDLLEMVGLPANFADRYPHEMSGGQRQRVGIVRALAVEPEILVLDEPVSALDVSVQAEVINLLSHLREELDLTYVFISHDLRVVRHVSSLIAVMYLGRIVELGTWRDVSDRPLHPYTQALQEAVPVPDPRTEGRRLNLYVKGEVPDPASPPSGCPFHPRCPVAETICTVTEPPLEELRKGHYAACHVAARLVVRTDQGSGL